MKIYINDGKLAHTIETKRLIFSGGEVQVRIVSPLPNHVHEIYIEHDIFNSDDIMELLLIINAFKEHYKNNINEKIILKIPYLPYSRQDRVCHEGEAFSLKVFGELLNSLNLKKIVTYDVHSSVAHKVIDRLYNVESAELFLPFIKELIQKSRGARNFIVLAPDKGAVNRANYIAEAAGLKCIQATKHRDPNTGNITKTEINCEHLGNTDIIIFDDICDGGRTFIELAKVAKTITDGKILLCITHGIFSKGIKVFDELIDVIVVANLFPQKESRPDNVFLLEMEYGV